MDVINSFLFLSYNVNSGISPVTQCPLCLTVRCSPRDCSNFPAPQCVAVIVRNRSPTPLCNDVAIRIKIHDRKKKEKITKTNKQVIRYSRFAPRRINAGCFQSFSLRKGDSLFFVSSEKSICVPPFNTRIDSFTLRIHRLLQCFTIVISRFWFVLPREICPTKFRNRKFIRRYFFFCVDKLIFGGPRRTNS